MEQAGDGVVVTDTSGIIQYVNPAFTAMTGYTGAEAVGRRPSILKSGSQPGAFYAELWKTIGSGRIWRGELTNRRKDGSLYTEEMANYSRGGRRWQNCQLHCDQTRRNGGTGGRGSARVPGSGGGKFDGRYSHLHSRGRIRTPNRGAEAALGYTAREAIGKSYLMLVLPDRIPNVTRFSQEVSGRAPIPPYKSFCLHRDGRRIPMSIPAMSPVRGAAGEVVAVSAILRDISEQRDADRKLRESEERFRGAFEHAPTGMCVTRMDGSFLQVNAEFCRMLGYSEEQLSAIRWPATHYADDREASARVLAPLLSGASSCEGMEKRYIHRSGGIVWVRTRIALMRDAAGAPRHCVVHVEDITDRRRAEEALRKSEELFRLFMDNNPALAWMKDEQGRYVYLNETYLKRFGFGVEEMQGKTDLEFRPREIAEQLRRNDRIALETGHSVEFAEEVPGPDGAQFFWTAYKFPFQDVSGQIFVGGIGLDVTERRRAEEALQESEERFRIMADGCPTMMWVTNAEGGNRFINRAYRQFAGIDFEEAEERKWELLVHPDDVHGYIEAFERAIRERAPFSAEVRVRRADGEWRWLASDAAPRFSAGGEFLGLVGISPDITARKQAEQTLQNSEEKFRQFAESIREVFWMMDSAATRIFYVSPAYEQIWGQTCESLYADPSSWIYSIHPEDREAAEATFLRQVEGELLENEYRILQPSGDIRWIRDRAFPVCDQSGNIVRLAGVAEDITDRKLADFQMRHQALYDELTDLPNRRLFRDRLEQAVEGCEAGKSGAVFFIDIDQFKLVNDTMGHQTGDRLLREVALRLLAVSSASATLARFGGDEFIMVDAGFDGPEAVRRLGDKLIACLDDPFTILDREFFIGVSIGISMFPGNGTDPHVLNTTANLAMHEAKRAGKHQIKFFTNGLADRARERLDLETRLRRAVALSEFELHFQPQFAVGKSHATRFEALVRWSPPGGPPIQPLKFIPLAEQNGLIIPLGTWILEEACRRCAAWQTGSLLGAGVAVNVSALQFACPDFIETVAGTLQSTGLSPHLLELELTESVFIQDVVTSNSTLRKLRQLGVTIALDDFGTGYSSLSYLQNLHIDALKIDRGFPARSRERKTGSGGNAVCRRDGSCAGPAGYRGRRGNSRSTGASGQSRMR